jgi:micrococcal nuclease
MVMPYKRKRANIIPIIFFVIVSIVYLVHEKYSDAKKSSFKEGVVKVVEVHDGDTVSVVIGNKVEKVRLIGIDAPELGQQPWGIKSKNFLKDIISKSNWEVSIEFDVEKRDKYNRLLAYLKTKDGILINSLMLKHGYALLYTVPPNVKYVDVLRRAQKEARDKAIGIWSMDGLKETPSQYRYKNPRID